MKITILGTGCAGCKALFERTQEVVKSLNLDAEVCKEEDMIKIMRYNVMTLPAIVINDKVVAKGKLSTKELTELLSKY